MHITVAARLRPFTHEPGSLLLVPGSPFAVRIYPTRIEVFDLSNSTLTQLGSADLNIQGPVDDFTAQVDLEKGGLHVWGKTATGFLRYHIWPDQQSISVDIEKRPKGFEFISETILLRDAAITLKKTARLSLGSHKAQDWESIRRRCDLADILPMWMRAGALLNSQVSDLNNSALGLLRDAIVNRQSGLIEPILRQLYLSGMQGLLVPSNRDTRHLGFDLPPLPASASPLSLLSKGANLIGRLFVDDYADGLAILPLLPPSFISGRLIGFSTGWADIDLEWSKGLIRRMVLKAKRTDSLRLTLQSQVRTFRMRKGERGHPAELDASVSFGICEGEVILFDRFQK